MKSREHKNVTKYPLNCDKMPILAKWVFFIIPLNIRQNMHIVCEYLFYSYYIPNLVYPSRHTASTYITFLETWNADFVFITASWMLYFHEFLAIMTQLSRNTMTGLPQILKPVWTCNLYSNVHSKSFYSRRVIGPGEEGFSPPWEDETKPCLVNN